jgi:hypothetical protein
MPRDNLAKIWSPSPPSESRRESASERPRSERSHSSKARSASPPPERSQQSTRSTQRRQRDTLAQIWSPSPPSERSRQSTPTGHGSTHRARDSIGFSGPEVNTVSEALSTFHFAPSAAAYDPQIARRSPSTVTFTSTQLRSIAPDALPWGSSDPLQQPRDDHPSERRSDGSPPLLRESASLQSHVRKENDTHIFKCDICSTRKEDKILADYSSLEKHYGTLHPFSEVPVGQSKPPGRPPPALPPFPELRPLRPANYDELEEYRSRGRDSNPPEVQPPLAPLARQADSAIDIPPQIIKEPRSIWRCVFKDPKRGYCGRAFTKEAPALRHHGEVHRGLQFVCPECEKPEHGHKNAFRLNEHMRKEHKDLDMKARNRIIQTLFNDQDCDWPRCTKKIDGHRHNKSRK